jgi:hypothetical protein
MIELKVDGALFLPKDLSFPLAKEQAIAHRAIFHEQIRAVYFLVHYHSDMDFAIYLILRIMINPHHKHIQLKVRVLLISYGF